MFFFFQAEDGIRDLVRSRGLGDVYKRQSSGKSLGYAHQGIQDAIEQAHRLDDRASSRQEIRQALQPETEQEDSVCATFAEKRTVHRPSLDKEGRNGSRQERQEADPVSYTHLRAHETVLDIVCRLLLEKKKQQLITLLFYNTTLF